MFNSKKLEDIVPSSHNCDVSHVNRTDYQLIDISEDSFVSLLTENDNTKDDLRLLPMKVFSASNADRPSWQELTVLASHVHPSVVTMAKTLLSGANIVYNGDPLNDQSLNAFLDKFMEKKPKPSKKAERRWHGGSQIAPARKAAMMMRMQVILAVMLEMMMMMMMMPTIPTVRRGRSQMEQAGNHHLQV